MVKDIINSKDYGIFADLTDECFKCFKDFCHKKSAKYDESYSLDDDMNEYRRENEEFFKHLV